MESAACGVRLRAFDSLASVSSSLGGIFREHCRFKSSTAIAYASTDPIYRPENPIIVSRARLVDGLEACGMWHVAYSLSVVGCSVPEKCGACAILGSS